MIVGKAIRSAYRFYTFDDAKYESINNRIEWQ
jgi:hypothetical protein